MKPRTTVFLLLVLLTITATYEMLRGRVGWCQQHDWNPIALHVNSPHNSQHFLDLYSFSHLLHGLIFFGVLWFARNKLSFNARVVIATLIECLWEMTENSPIIIDRYRATTVSLGYVGDSIADVLCAIAGFYRARALGLWKSVALLLIIEVVMLLVIRDNLTLNVLMLLYPIDAIRKWQADA